MKTILSPSMTKKIYLIAGEASGDLHGSNLIRELRKEARFPLEIYGAGGDHIRDTGALEFLDLAHFHVTGITEAIRKLPKYKEASKILLKKIQRVKPDLVVLIDNPGFNLHLARHIHGWGIPIVYYIAPQVWAWSPKRLLKIKKLVSKVLVVFDFEEKLYREHGIPVCWVGHPLKDLIASGDGAKFSRRKGPLISLLPGSRKGELKMLFKIFLRTAEKLSETLPEATFTVIKSSTLPLEFYRKFVAGSKVRVEIIEKNSYDVIRSSDLAIVCSGTATLECALLGTPMIISNRGSLITYLAVKSVLRVPYLGLPNLVLGSARFPEFLQYDATPEKLSAEAVRILSDRSVKDRMKKDLEEVSRKLGEPGAARRAAIETLRLV